MNGFRPRPGPLNKNCSFGSATTFLALDLRQRIKRLCRNSARANISSNDNASCAASGTLDFQAHVPPAIVDAVAFVFRRDVEAADERHLFIAHEQLAMIADGQPFQGDRIELADFAARASQRIPKMVRTKNTSRPRPRAPAPARRVAARAPAPRENRVPAGIPQTCKFPGRPIGRPRQWPRASRGKFRRPRATNDKRGSVPVCISVAQAILSGEIFNSDDQRMKSVQLFRPRFQAADNMCPSRKKFQFPDFRRILYQDVESARTISCSRHLTVCAARIILSPVWLGDFRCTPRIRR